MSVKPKNWMLSNINRKCHLSKFEEFKIINVTGKIEKAGSTARSEDFLTFQSNWVPIKSYRSPFGIKKQNKSQPPIDRHSQPPSSH